MSLPAAPAAPAAMSSRYFLVGYLPAYASLLFLLVLVWADGGPGTSFKRAWRTAAALSAAQIVLIALLVLLLTLLATPFQLSLVRLLEAGWPGRLGAAATRRQLDRKHELARAAELTGTDDAAVLRAGRAGWELRHRFPLPDHLVRPTGLGNILAAMEDRAGRDYGLDAVIAWPRLYPMLNAGTKAVVDDRRGTLDLLTRLTVTGFVTALAALVILLKAGVWVLLAVVPAGVGVLAYLGALRAALAYGESVQAAFDTHHLTFGAALGLDRPATPEAERQAYRQLCDLWRQGVPPTYSYAADQGKT